MKKFKYNLLGILPPDGYRWVKRNERYLDVEYFWYLKDGVENIIAQNLGTYHSPCDYDFPTNNRYWGLCGYIRPLE